MFVITIFSVKVIRNYPSLGKRIHLMHSIAKYRILQFRNSKSDLVLIDAIIYFILGSQ